MRAAKAVTRTDREIGPARLYSLVSVLREEKKLIKHLCLSQIKILFSSAASTFSDASRVQYLRARSRPVHP